MEISQRTTSQHSARGSEQLGLKFVLMPRELISPFEHAEACFDLLPGTSLAVMNVVETPLTIVTFSYQREIAKCFSRLSRRLQLILESGLSKIAPLVLFHSYCLIALARQYSNIIV
jgi:hypothetical protein